MARGEAFADTSALYAAVDARDAHHRNAALLMRQLAQTGRMIVTTDYVVAETLNLAVARRGRIVADRLLQLLETSSGLRMEWIGSGAISGSQSLLPQTRRSWIFVYRLHQLHCDARPANSRRFNERPSFYRGRFSDSAQANLSGASCGVSRLCSG